MTIRYLLSFIFMFCFGVIHSQPVNMESSKAELLAYHISNFGNFEFVPDQLIVKLNHELDLNEGRFNSPDQKVNVALSVLNAVRVKQVFDINRDKNTAQKESFGLFRYYLVDFSAGTDLKQALMQLAALEAVEVVEPNYIAHTTVIPNDPLYVEQWALNNTGQAVQYNTGTFVGTPGVDLAMEGAWGITTGSSDVIVSIIDEGVDLSHPEFAGRLVPGYDFINNDNDPNPSGNDAHGTACAGIVGASGNNGLGVAGIAWNVKIMPVKSMEGGSGSWTAIANGIVWSADNGADILSMSLGGGGYVTSVETACNYAFGLGATIFASAGNDNSDLTTSPQSPAVFPNVICVGAMSPCDERKNPGSCDGESWWGSNYGSDLDFMAPGTRNYTTDITGGAGYSSGDYAQFFNGTSSACPHAAGVAALILSADLSLTNTEIRTLMQNSCVDMDVAGFDNQTGYGRVNAYNALSVLNPPTCDIVFNPAFQNAAPGEEFSVEIWVEDVENLAAYDFLVSYEPEYMDWLGYDLGDFIYTTGRTQLLAYVDLNPVSGTFYFSQGTSGDSPPGPDGDGRLFTAHFKVKDEPLALETLHFNVLAYEMSKPDGSQIFATVGTGSVSLDNYCSEGLYYSGCSDGDRFTYLAMADMENVSETCNPDAYHDFSDVVINVLQGVSYDLMMEVGFGGQYVFAWIDLNDNVEFEDSEKVLDGFYIDAAGVREQTTISVLNDFPPGEHRLRLRTVWSNDEVDPCGVYSYGEIQDYTINIHPDDQYAQIQGFVFDAETLDPVLSALPEVVETGGQDEPSQNGFYSFIVEAGSISLSCSAPGYATVSVGPVTLAPGEVFLNDFFLEQATCSEDLFVVGCSEGDGINDFFFNHIRHPASGCSEGGYGDFTDMKTILAKGATYTCEVSTDYNVQFMSIWIDMNDNYNFEPEELVLDNAYLDFAGTLYAFDVAIPETCPPGEHIMRARMNFSEPINDACELVFYGEVHEYTVEIFDASEMGSLQGTVYNWDFDAPQSGIEINLPELGISTVSDFDGDYNFGSVPGGSVNLVVAQDGYFNHSESADIVPLDQTFMDITVKPVHQNNFDFPEGWSGVSSSFFINHDVHEIFGIYEDQFVIVSSQTGFYYPGENVNTLNHWEDSPGYMIKTNQAFGFSFPGYTRKPADLIVPAGWSILPGWSDCPVGIADVFNAGGSPPPVIVKEIGGTGVYWPDMGIYSLTDLEPNKAYHVLLVAAATVSYPECVLKATSPGTDSKIENNTTWPTPAATSNSHLIYISEKFVNDAGLSTGDYLGAFDARGNCFGLTPLAGKNNHAITAFANDPTTVAKDGFDVGEIIYIRAFVADAQETRELNVEYDADMPNHRFFATEGLSSASLKSTGFADGVSNGVFTVYPNPTSGMFSISMDTKIAMDRVEIYDSRGQLIHRNIHLQQGADGILNVDLGGLPSGIYSVRVVANDRVFDEKIVLQ